MARDAFNFALSSMMNLVVQLFVAGSQYVMIA